MISSQKDQGQKTKSILRTFGWLSAVLSFSFSVIPATAQSAMFIESFKGTKTIEEAGSMSTSSNPNWWVNSGGRMTMRGGTGWTVQGNLPAADRMRQLYSSSNPTDTDNGLHPQNLFRLVSRQRWLNTDQRVYAKVHATNMSASENRAGHNGLLLMSRYSGDGQTLYYAGVRVDGDAVIKKKVRGTYVTLSEPKLFPGRYNLQTNPNLIPSNTWIGLRLVTKNESDGSVTLQLYTDVNKTGRWKLTASARDNGQDATGTAIKDQNYFGIRTDFMDVEFGGYSNQAL